MSAASSLSRVTAARSLGVAGPFAGTVPSSPRANSSRESADSRVYAGIHFPSACEDGLALGRRIGQRVAKIYLQPVK